MKQTHKIYKLRILSLFILCIFYSCSNFLKEHSEDLAYVSTVEDLDELLLGDGYLQSPETNANNYNKFCMPYIHFLADETEEYIVTKQNNGANQARKRFYGYYTWHEFVGINEHETKISKESSDWLKIYRHINIANMILEEAEEMSKDKSNQKNFDDLNRIRGEALFLRASYYFVLVNLYANPYKKEAATTTLGVPLKLSSSVETKQFSREMLEKCYEQILKDIDASITLLPTKSSSIYRASKASSLLIKSRIHLYMQQWEESKNAAIEYLNNYNKLADLNTYNFSDKAFMNKTNPEIIFSMGGSAIKLEMNESSEGSKFSEELYRLYEEEDLRKTKLIKQEYKEDPKIPFTYTTTVKYKKSNSGREAISDVFVLRTAEAYLNLAEASLMLEDISTATEAINKLRQSRIEKSAYQSINPTSSSDLEKTIREERRKELCLEGHRWFDLRRYQVREKFPFSKLIQHTHTEYHRLKRLFVPLKTKVFELAPGDAAYTLAIPREVFLHDDKMIDNPREPREPVEIIIY